MLQVHDIDRDRLHLAGSGPYNALRVGSQSKSYMLFSYVEIYYSTMLPMNAPSIVKKPHSLIPLLLKDVVTAFNGFS